MDSSINFACSLLSLLKRVAMIDIAQAFTDINDDGVFQLEVIALIEGNATPIFFITENATETDICNFELQLDLLESSMKAQEAEDAENEAKIIAALNKLTPEERLLIERPLPEDLPPEDPDFCEYL